MNPEPTGPQGLGLLAIRRIVVPQAVVNEVQEFLREAGTSENEAVGFWAGKADGETFRVRAAVIPNQDAVSTEDGEVAVILSGDELFRMNVWLYRNGLTLVAQIHSHPGDAYHSETDDEFAVMTRVGGLSIVVPDFAREDFTLTGAAVHRLGPDGTWSRLSNDEAVALIHVVESDE